MSDMIKVKIDDKGLKRIMQQLQGKTNTKPLMRQMAGIMMDAVEENFAQEGRPHWKPLAVATLFAGKKSAIVGKSGKYRKSFERELRGRKILQVTGSLAGSVSSYSDDKSAVVGVPPGVKKGVGRAAALQLGTDRAGRNHKVKIPARPYLKLEQDNMDEMMDKASDFLEVK